MTTKPATDTQKYSIKTLADFPPQTPNKRALDQQVAGTHYKSMKIQPIEYIHANSLGYCEANVVKYISRWRDKGGKADLEKIKHYVDLLIELENL